MAGWESDKTYVLHRRAVIEQIQGDAGGVHPELSTVVPSFRHVASNLDVSELLPSTFSLRSVLPYFRTVFYDSTKIQTKIQSINPSFHTLEETRNREARTQDAGWHSQHQPTLFFLQKKEEQKIGLVATSNGYIGSHPLHFARSTIEVQCHRG